MFVLVLLALLAQWLTPIPEADVLHGYAPPQHSWQAGHRGVDFSAEPGSQVRSIGAGTVVFAGMIAGKPVISIDHPALGMRSTYEPVTPSVRAGDRVEAGEPIGSVAAAGGHCAGQCVHLGLRGPAPHDYRNPMDLFDSGHALLKPLAR